MRECCVRHGLCILFRNTVRIFVILASQKSKINQGVLSSASSPRLAVGAAIFRFGPRVAHIRRPPVSVDRCYLPQEALKEADSRT